MDESSTSIDPPGSLNSGSLSEELRRAISVFPDLPWDAGVPDRLNGVEDPFRALRPESAGIANLLALPENVSVLFWNWDGLAAGRHLRDLGHQVRFHDSRIKYQETARLLCGEESIQSLNDLDAENQTPDVVFVGATTDDSENLLSTLGNILKNTLDKGGIVVAAQAAALPHSASKASSPNYSDDGSLCQESVLALPNLDCPRLLIRDNFLHESRGAWKHLAGYVDELGAPRFPGSVPIREVWSLYEEHKRFPLQDVPRYRVLWRRDKVERNPLQVDFIHQSIGQRARPYWTKTFKPRGETMIERRPIFPPTDPPSTANDRNAPFKHLFGFEKYQTGATLAELWLDALRLDDAERFLALARKFVEFLHASTRHQSEVWIDLLADNVLVDDVDNFSSIDQEWRCPAERLSVDAMYCRALVYFLSRSALVLDKLSAARRWGVTHHDFVTGACEAVGITPESALLAIGDFEKEFRTATLREFGVIEIASMLKRRFGDHDVVEVVGSLRQHETVETHHILIPFPTSSSRSGCRFQFRFADCSGMPETLDLTFPRWLGSPRITAGTISNANGSYALYLMTTRPFEVEALARAPGVFSTDQMMRVQVEVKPELLVSASHVIGDIDIDIEIAWPEMIFGPEAGEKLVHRLWDKEGTLNRTRERVSALESELEESKEALRLKHAELELLKSSKAWRVAELLRKVFFAWRRTQDEARNLSAIEQLAQKPAPPTECFSHLNQLEKVESDADTGCVPGGPLISVIIPVHNTPKAWLADAVNSVRGQTYSSWHLVLVNDGSTDVGTREFLDNLDDPRVTKIQLTRSAGISIATQMGVDGAHGEYVALMDHDDMLAPAALQKVAEEIVRHKADLVYTDETTFSDRTKEKRDGYFGLPHLKPDYSPDLLLCHNYITHLLVVRKELIDQVGGFRPEFDGAQDYDLLLRLTEKTDRVVHIAEPLYHWRQSVQSTSLDTGAKPLAHMRGCQALSEALDRRGIEGEVLTANGPHFFRVRRKILGQPMVEVVIPFRDQPLMLRKCLDALLSRTRYSHYRILGVNNGSTEVLTHELISQYESDNSHVRFVTLDVPFNFSEIVNFGVQNSDAAHVVLMNNDIEVINNDWLEAMLEHSQRPEVGAVGAKLYYPDDTIQHAGIAIGIGNYAGHPHKHVEGGYSGYLNRLHNIQNVSAVTGAMMMVKRELYTDVEGFDEGSFKIACNDVDFCLRLRSRGLLNIFTPYARAYHHESVSRGYEDTPEKKARFDKEVDAFRKRHHEALTQGDPYYNRCFRLDTEEVLARPLNET